MYGNSATLFFSQGIGIWMYGYTYGQSHDNQIFKGLWVTKFYPLVCRSPAITTTVNVSTISNKKDM